MPCFKGLAVSIHTPSGPLPEFSIQKQSRLSRISSYIPVPPPKFTPGSDRPEQSNFAISITLLTPGSPVPYSRPAPTPEDPFPNHKIVGGLPGFGSERGKYSSGIGPYIPITASANETVAAYIHFDGRQKEEVATLLRRGVETWVNSRWVGVSESEGGGLAEREFLFREVGLERWLNGLDLKGESKAVAAKIERRKAKLEKKRRKKLMERDSDDEDEKDNVGTRARPLERNGVLRYGANQSSPVEDVSGDDGMSSTSDSEDEMPDPEATGQIKVSLFRVMASGEIKRGEYSPSFDAHDDDEDEGMQDGRNGNDPGIDHTTTFAKPKTLDPKSISTQTVTGIDDPSKPYATFTFFYRSERQLQKMGIMPRPKSPEGKPASASKQKSRQVDLSGLGPLKSTKGTVGFAGYRDPTSSGRKSSSANGKKSQDDDMDSDGEDEGPSKQDAGKAGKKPSVESEDATTIDEEAAATLSPDELKRRGELAEGVEKMQLKRQRSFDPSQSRLAEETSDKTITGSLAEADNKSLAPSDLAAAASGMQPLSAARFSDSDPSASIGSPYKKQRGSVSAVEPRKLFSTPTSAASGTGPSSGQTSFASNPDGSSATSFPGSNELEKSSLGGLSASTDHKPAPITSNVSTSDSSAAGLKPTLGSTSGAGAAAVAAPSKTDSQQDDVDVDEEL